MDVDKSVSETVNPLPISSAAPASVGETVAALQIGLEKVFVRRSLIIFSEVENKLLAEGRSRLR